jgi:hypothetical protein
MMWWWLLVIRTTEKPIRSKAATTCSPETQGSLHIHHNPEFFSLGRFFLAFAFPGDRFLGFLVSHHRPAEGIRDVLHYFPLGITLACYARKGGNVSIESSLLSGKDVDAALIRLRRLVQETLPVSFLLVDRKNGTGLIIDEEGEG